MRARPVRALILAAMSLGFAAAALLFTLRGQRPLSDQAAYTGVAISLAVAVGLLGGYVALRIDAARARCRDVRSAYPGSRPQLLSFTPQAGSTALVWLGLASTFGAAVCLLQQSGSAAPWNTIRPVLIAVAAGAVVSWTGIEIWFYRRSGGLHRWVDSDRLGASRPEASSATHSAR